MSEMTFNATSGTGASYPATDISLNIKTVFLASCLLSTGIAFIPAANLNDADKDNDSIQGLFQILGNKIDSSRSVTDISSSQSDEDITNELTAELSNFYQTLAARQEPLGKDFEKVLYQNIEELYI